MPFSLIPEYALSREDRQQVADLVQRVFPEDEYRGRAYFKQHAHARILLREKGVLVGQVGLDYRTMTVNKQPVNVLGLIDVIVEPNLQGQRIGSRLLAEVDRVAEMYQHNIDALFLVAERHSFYARAGYRLITQTATWLQIDQHTNYGMKTERFDQYFMVKEMGDFVWPNEADLDMLGYWY